MTSERREVDEFIAEILPRVRAMDLALHHGDVAPRVEMWSHRDPVTVFGAVLSASGWDAILPIFQALASQFSKGTYEYEVVAAGVSDDLAYIAGFEHTTAAVGSGDPKPYHLRVTTIFRREDGQWKIVHRHADPMPGSDETQRQVARLDSQLRSGRS
ncbi:MAG: nuclear transport factor 2 family protein [Chloroflexota bacterium]|nr:nuclear transport factor 2 family protein [Chloroflexota bacterium]